MSPAQGRRGARAAAASPRVGHKRGLFGHGDVVPEAVTGVSAARNASRTRAARATSLALPRRAARHRGRRCRGPEDRRLRWGCDLSCMTPATCQARGGSARRGVRGELTTLPGSSCRCLALEAGVRPARARARTAVCSLASWRLPLVTNPCFHAGLLASSCSCVPLAATSARLPHHCELKGPVGNVASRCWILALTSGSTQRPASGFAGIRIMRQLVPRPQVVRPCAAHAPGPRRNAAATPSLHTTSSRIPHCQPRWWRSRRPAIPSPVASALCAARLLHVAATGLARAALHFRYL